MKKITLICAALLIVSCGTSQKEINLKKQSVASQNPTVKSLKKPATIVAISDIQKAMNYLASDELEGRETGSKGIEKAAVFIENYFKQHGIKPYFETYRDSFNIKKITGYNIVGIIEGNDPKLKHEFVILGGHYDHIGFSKAINGDTIANGANDDASGTIAAMEFGKYFAKSKTNKRSLLITLFSAEEMGLKGSAHLAERLKMQGLNAYTMLNFEMIGVPRAANEPLAYMSGYERSNFAETLNKYAGENVVAFFPKAKSFGLFRRSDNFPFFKALKMPAHAISTFDFSNFDYYHHVDDEADKMDYEHMARFMNKMIPALEGMINAPTKEVVLNEK